MHNQKATFTCFIIPETEHLQLQWIIKYYPEISTYGPSSARSQGIVISYPALYSGGPSMHICPETKLYWLTQLPSVLSGK